MFECIIVQHFKTILQASKKSKKSSDAVESSLTKMTDTLSAFMQNKNDAKQQQPSVEPPLKFAYIWQNLDHLFQKLDQQDVIDLNLKFITLTCEKLKAKPDGQ